MTNKEILETFLIFDRKRQDFRLEEVLKEAHVEGAKLKLWMDVSSLLRLMDRFLQDEISAESFVDKFTETFLEITDWGADPTLDSKFDDINEYYGKIQRYSPVKNEREHEPLLIDLNELKELTRSIYSELKEAWLLSVMQH